ncbi:hypothetical protein KSP39_PZI005905 [Platanthera zijinensis]|uniref:Uncharacterized protein n=1 Tax=Platanthera zijinensis TaxID=2320716 RepID=A0AAP0GAB7_9ASPA
MRTISLFSRKPPPSRVTRCGLFLIRIVLGPDKASMPQNLLCSLIMLPHSGRKLGLPASLASPGLRSLPIWESNWPFESFTKRTMRSSFVRLTHTFNLGVLAISPLWGGRF